MPVLSSMVTPPEIEDNFLGMLTENFRQFQFHFARAVAQDDASVHFEDVDVGRYLLSLDSQDHGAPRCQEARRRRRSIAIGLGSVASTDSTSRTSAVERNSMDSEKSASRQTIATGFSGSRGLGRRRGKDEMA